MYTPETTQSFELLFKNAEDKNKKINIKDPAQNIQAQDVETALSVIVASDIFVKDGIDSYAAPVGGRYVTRTVEDVYVAPKA